MLTCSNNAFNGSLTSCGNSNSMVGLFSITSASDNAIALVASSLFNLFDSLYACTVNSFNMIKLMYCVVISSVNIDNVLLSNTVDNSSSESTIISPISVVSFDPSGSDNNYNNEHDNNNDTDKDSSLSLWVITIVL